ncbi:MAG: hypothetical protein Q8N94_08670 [Methanoregula sp.]|nr:hypothetical protein [Methanoregula sp.]
MTGKKETDISWRHTSVVVRADIFSKAHEQGIDISNVCNMALAELLGTDYRPQHLDNVPVTRPVIIAQNASATEGKVHAQVVHPAEHAPVINADDPAASLTVRKAKQQPKIRPAQKEPERVTAPPEKEEVAALSPAAHTAPAGKVKKPAAGKAHKDDWLKKFVSTKITRSDADDAVCTKDDMYQAFARFCREHKIAQVPDQKSFSIALKNKFAFFDKTMNGTPGWVNVRLK